MSGKSASGSNYGGNGGLADVAVGLLRPGHVLTAKFTATGPSAAIPVAAGIGDAQLQTFVFGSPTTATVIAEGSQDGLSWYPLPTVPNSSNQVYSRIRLNCTALSGGTTPAIVAVAIALP